MGLLNLKLRSVARRLRRLGWWRSVAVVCLLAAAMGAVLLGLQVNSIWMHQRSGLILATATMVGVLAISLMSYFRFRDPRWIARKIEQRFPDLEQRLVTTLDELQNTSGMPLRYLQHTVLQETLAHARRNAWWRVVTPGSLHGMRVGGWCALILLLASVVGLMRWQPTEGFASTAISDAIFGFADSLPIVVPGDTEVEKGSHLIVTAQFGKHIPKEAELLVMNDSGEQVSPMVRNLEDPIFSATVLEVMREFQYAVVYDGQQTRMYRVGIFVYPALVRADAVLAFPSYTGQPQKRVQDTRRVSAVEGTRLTWQLRLNKPVASARLVTADGESMELQPDPRDPRTQIVSMELKQTMTWRLELEDADGRGNRNPPRLTAKVLPNRPPDLKLEIARDARVSPLEEFLVKAIASDDYGLLQYGLTYMLATASAQDVLLGGKSKRREKRVAEHLIDFEALEVEPDDLLSYYFWAEDYDAAGQPRRTFSDMYFAEVRHFEEIFRQGQQPPGGQQQQQQQQQQQSQNAQDAEQLAELQKQIINATWKLIRRETAPEPTPVFKEDVSLILESQETAVDQTQQLGGQITDEQSQQHMLDVRRQMQQSLKKLMEAYSGPDVKPLTPALQAQQAAYQALLKLRAREHEVVQSQSRSSSSASRGASRARFQQQLEQLQLRNDQNRYETQRQAQQQEDQEQTELRQALSRLRELARRQDDLNKQLKELQTALEQAETEEERAEIERQLKRLRDQQREMLRDTDELMDRLDESQNQEVLQDTRDQLEDTREQLRDSAESLERGEVTPALASGTRAQRELEELREELRRESANQFSEQMREMRETAQKLEKDQQELGEKLAEQAESTEDQTGLRSETPAEERLGDALREQNERLNDLLQQIEETVREAEESEPLLADKLYDAFQETERDHVVRNLEAAAQLTDRRLNQQARQLENEARQGITNLRENVEQAAESVLGDETEALRRALDTIDQLAQELENEIQQFDGSRDQTDNQDLGQPDRSEQAQQRTVGQQNEDRQEPQDPSAQSQRERSDQPSDAQDRTGQDQPPGESQQQRPNESTSQSPSEQPPSQSPAGDGQQSSERDSQNPSQNSPSSQSEGSPSNQQGNRERQSLRPSRAGQRTDQGGTTGGAWGGLDRTPLTGDDFRSWSDRLRDVEEIVGDPELRAEAARIRDRARGFRREFKRHSEEPKWPLVRELVAQPLRELRKRVSLELLRRSADKNALVPIDRDPVPDQFSESVRRYYENLGSGE